ncbi:GNAT family N-acetyltransferase [Leptospira kanakyensis]|uniref:GNAT family N-acetyltransferase n=1 Tax=Leptospira kanakyensis TaxID=2484968 RepID=UPI00223C9C71|nr:GNAT family N-acetyltransferase [Leptospira kanakyensis]MCW7482144.1 GNAT family N-acetyltransferase [Leptospira kanakyensis]
MNFKVRLATIKDSKQLFDWVNDPAVRKASFNTSRINWQDHEKWFQEKIRSSNSIILIFEADGISVGQIRFDKEINNNYIIDFSIQKDFRGLSYGTIIIRIGIDYMVNLFSRPITFTGKVKLENLNSIKAFQNNEFVKISETDYFLTFQKSL